MFGEVNINKLIKTQDKLMYEFIEQFATFRGVLRYFLFQLNWLESLLSNYNTRSIRNRYESPSLFIAIKNLFHVLENRNNSLICQTFVIS